MKLSIITPSYNQAKFIEQTLKSVLDQKLGKNLEYFVIDAVSTDDTAKIVKKYVPLFKKQGCKFKFIQEKDRGQADAINKGWRMATGDIITYLNSDDFYQPKTLKKVLRFFDTHANCQWAYGGWNLVDESGKVKEAIQHRVFSKSKLLNYCNIGQPSTFFRRSIIDLVGYLDERLHFAMDYDLWLRIAVKEKAHILPFVIANMRYHKDAKSCKNNLQQLKESFRIGLYHTSVLSYRRLAQYFFFLRGWLVILLKIDIANRIDGKYNFILRLLFSPKRKNNGDS